MKDEQQPMYRDAVKTRPASYAAIEAASRTIGFSMPSDLQTGALLQTLVAAKSNAIILEIGTGTGLATAWLLAGMTADSTLISIDTDPFYQAIAKQELGHDSRLQLVCADAGEWLETNDNQPFDLIFADAWPGKYSHLDQTLNQLKPAGLYIIDDMMAQPNWPDGHQRNVDELVGILEARTDIQLVKLAWSTGIMLVVKK